MPRMTEQEAQKAHGCWLEGHRGWRASGDVVHIAYGYGMPLDEDDSALLDAYLSDDYGIDYDLTLSTGEEVSVGGAVIDQGGLADQAEQYLNTEVAPEGWAFGWRDGEFFLLPDHEWHDEEPVEGCPECGCLA